jgi:hypothetical protein
LLTGRPNNHTDLVYYFITLHHVSAVQISHYQVGAGYTKRV